jgi:predicted SprT family Zn-dependent metalloprotease
MKKPIIHERHFSPYEKAWGQCFLNTKLIEIDPRQKSKKYLGTLIHELLHYYFPKLSEKRVLKLEKQITEILWKKGFRRIRK